MMHPLLINLSEELEIPLAIYSYAPIEEKDTEKTLGIAVIGKTWSTMPCAGFVFYTLKDWMLSPIYYSDVGYKNRNQIVKDYANNMGPSHYTDEVPHSIETLRRMPMKTEGSPHDGVILALCDISEAVLWLGKRLLLLHKLKLLEASIHKDDVAIREINEKTIQHDQYYESLGRNGSKFIVKLG